jgi:hypothetical protein
MAAKEAQGVQKNTEMFQGKYAKLIAAPVNCPLCPCQLFFCAPCDTYFPEQLFNKIFLLKCRGILPGNFFKCFIKV